ncbi:NAD-dependent epimerase/dehydratase family protein [Nonomuraea sp. KC401]|uniref:NAD-dependent epimerase/dehydratase family protein n=1 Tax=unclassified Nonomuraea TaxID=2593643 RepID=UPI0010FD68E0|nr:MULTISPECIES: NAD-dependent epimerase/dehydratase family protein [unclassified Nonomuraea]NBE94342.1 NAD-dependent epimerase/dehydratase family protein [Nonomuraea sp. K271]TLF73125.1 NAD-dependent epimerase/dehydratase family protein [Nonomuraea sp. KC401]
MRVVVIGGSGHIGTYLIPRLVAAGHDVVAVSRGKREPYTPHAAWRRVEQITVDRTAEESGGTFGRRVAELGGDVVIDLICFTEDSARHLAQALTGRVRHFLHCGTIWVHGPSMRVPATEDLPRRPIAEYGRQKAAIEAYLLDRAHRDGFPATIIHPGHITGPGWVPVNPAGNVNPAVFQTLADGAELALPNLGMETVQHVHADDVARLFMDAMASPAAARGETFHSVSTTAVTLRGYAEAVAGWFGQEARLTYLPWEQWRTTVTEEDAKVTYDHIAHSPHCGMEKAARLLGHRPRYTALDAVSEAVDRLVAAGTIVAAT